MPTARLFVSFAAAIVFIFNCLTASAAHAAIGSPSRAKTTAGGSRALPTKSVKRVDLRVEKISPRLTAPSTNVLSPAHPLRLKGWVTTDAGLPLPGATVWLTNTHQQVVVANVSGEFYVQLPDDKAVSITVGYGGYTDQVLVLNHPRTQNGLIVTLQPLTKRP